MCDRPKAGRDDHAYGKSSENPAPQPLHWDLTERFPLLNNRPRVPADHAIRTYSPAAALRTPSTNSLPHSAPNCS